MNDFLKCFLLEWTIFVTVGWWSCPFPDWAATIASLSSLLMSFLFSIVLTHTEMLFTSTSLLFCYCSTCQSIVKINNKYDWNTDEFNYTLFYFTPRGWLYAHTGTTFRLRNYNACGTWFSGCLLEEIFSDWTSLNFNWIFLY